jgi:diguanylate cyclase (GGDEF)-like protein
MACLGGRAELAVLQSATGLSAPQLEQRLEPALEDGLLVVESGRWEAVRFRHDQVQEELLRRLSADRCDALRLRLARRLAGSPELFHAAAEQYLPVIERLSSERERRQVAGLLRQGADRAQLLSNFSLVERCLTAAARLIDPADRLALVKVHTGRHAALYSLARLEDADEAYQTVMSLCADPAEEADATLVQVSSLTNRNRPQQAVKLGLDLLRRLGHPAPAGPQLPAEVDRGLDAFTDWFRRPGHAGDLRRPELTDRRLLTVGALINRIMPPAYFSDHDIMGWLALEAWRIWIRHGPGATLVGPVSHIPYAIVVRRGDHRTAHDAGRAVLQASEAHGYEPATSQARFLYSLAAWAGEPLEECLRQAELAREGLIRGGDLQNACFSRHVSFVCRFECAPSLQDSEEEVEAALTAARRTGNDQFAAGYRVYQELVRTLRGDEPGLAVDRLPPEAFAGNPTALVHLHLAQALVSAVFGGEHEFEARTAAVMSHLPLLTGTYPSAMAHLLRGLALAEAARNAPAAGRPALLSELDTVIEWLSARAADSPENLLPLLRLVEAERSWTAGEFRTAIGAFDTAVREVTARQRPWQRALTLERASRFHLSQGLEHTGQVLLTQAYQAYQAWGATAKVKQLDWAYPALQWESGPVGQASGTARAADLLDPPVYRSRLTPGTIDMLGIHAASRVLSSETTIEGLRNRIVEVLSAMTGATGVQLLLWGEEEQGWLLAGEADAALSPVDGGRRLLPTSAIRYVERTGDPLVVADATRDDRFARDPYLHQLGTCSLMVVPVRSRGELGAMLLLENRLIRNAFTADRLDGVLLIAGQLAVSLRNALVYSSLEHKVAQRTEELALANARLEQLSITDPLTGLPNRRRLQAVLRSEWERAQRTQTPLALAMVDIDHFKSYNDHYGHAAGDRCLQRVATLLRQRLRETDLAARYGGEEFAMVMPHADLATAVQVANCLRTAVAELAEPHPEAARGIVTASIGVASVTPQRTGQVEELIESADTELYRAKRSGRDRVRPELPPRPAARPVSDLPGSPQAADR